MSAPQVARVREALIDLDDPPQGPGWNHDLVAEWIDSAPLVPAAVLVGVRDGGEENVLFTRRQARLAHHAGQVAFPGGRMDADDVDLVDTALRETEEEIGLPRSAIEPLGFLEPLETVSGFCVTPVVARVAADAPPLRPSADEVAEVFEVPLAFLLDPANMRSYMAEHRGRRHRMSEFLFDGHRIWGATAGMWFNLLQRMGVA
ncbi:MAG TPA: CoA pyrophosphatase [Rhodanobacteraceae bacterium]